MAPSNKFFPFVKLTRCAQTTSYFLAEYKNLPRNSGMCYELYLEVVKAQAIIRFLQAQIGKLFDFAQPGFLPTGFVTFRQAEEKQYLDDLIKALQESFSFLKAFSSIRAKRLKEFGESKEVQKAMRKNGFVKKYPQTIQKLREVVEAWYNSVKQEQGETVEQQFFVKFCEEIFEEGVNNRPVFPGSISLVSDLKERIRHEDHKVDWKRVGILIPVIEDINGSLHHVQLDVILKDAKKRFAKNDPKKKKGKGKTPVSEEEEPEEAELAGLRTLGPFAVHAVKQRLMKYFDFEACEKTTTFKVDLSLFLSEQKRSAERIFEGRLSPFFKVTLQDFQTMARLKIPESAVACAFVYPIDDLDISIPSWLGSQNEFVGFKSVILYGGYAYLDENGKLVGLNGLEQGGSDLFFTGPHLLEDKYKGKIEELDRDGRWADITIPQLRALGACKFAWLRPGELGAHNHGCFIYQYDDETWSPTYFDVVNVSVGKLMMDQTSSRRLQEVLDTYMPGKA